MANGTIVCGWQQLCTQSSHISCIDKQILSREEAMERYGLAWCEY